MLATSGVWEPHVTAVVRRFLGPGDVFVDVGANIGYFTLLGARLVGTAGASTRWSRRPGRTRSSSRTSSGTGCGTSCPSASPPVRRAARRPSRTSSRAATPAPRRSGAIPAGVGRRTGGPGHRPAPALADVVPAADWPRLRLVKVDVEGYESDVLTGLEPILDAGHRPAVVVELHSDIDPDAVGFLADFARRFDLAVRHIVDRPGAERRWAAQNPLLAEYDDPASLAAVDDPRVDVLLTATGLRPRKRSVSIGGISRRPGYDRPRANLGRHRRRRLPRLAPLRLPARRTASG